MSWEGLGSKHDLDRLLSGRPLPYVIEHTMPPLLKIELTKQGCFQSVSADPCGSTMQQSDVEYLIR